MDDREDAEPDEPERHDAECNGQGEKRAPQGKAGYDVAALGILEFHIENEKGGIGEKRADDHGKGVTDEAGPEFDPPMWKES